MIVETSFSRVSAVVDFVVVVVEEKTREKFLENITALLGQRSMEDCVAFSS